MAKPKSFTVLVASDGSEEATAAVNAVAIFPWPAGTRAHGVVVRSGAALVDVPEHVWAEVDRGYAAVAEGARKVLARRWPDAEVRVVNGPTVPAIFTRARQVGARSIVVGSRGHGPIARLLLGSTSLGIVRALKHTALVVRGRPRSFARVAVGLDGSAHSRRTVAFLAGLDVPAGGHITIISVHEPIAVPSLGLVPSGARTMVRAQADKENAAAVQGLQREIDAATAVLRRAGWRVESAIRKGAPLHELLAATKSARVQLLAVGARGKTGAERLLMGSVCEGALHRASVCVLLVR